MAEPDRIRRSTLANGIAVISEHIPGLRSLSLGVWLTLGSRHEPRELSGICHFIEHMVFKGTTGKDTVTIARAIDAIGGQMNAFTSKESVCFYARVLDQHLPTAIDLLGELLLEPAFRDVDVERERKVILEEIKMVHDTPDDLIQDQFVAGLWKGHPLARPILGSRRTVSALDSTRLRSFFVDHLRPGNLLVTAAGNVDHEDLAARLERALGAVAGATAPIRSTPPRAQASIRLRSRAGLKQTYLCLGAPALARSHPDYPALAVLNTVLGAGMSSRLFQRVREERSLAYDVFSDVQGYHDAGYLLVYAGTAAGAVRELLAVVSSELAALRTDGITTEELTGAKAQLKGNLMLGLESSFDRMNRLAMQEIYHRRQQGLDELLAEIESVAAGDVLRVGRQVLEAGSWSVTLLGRLPEGLTAERSALAF